MRVCVRAHGGLGAPAPAGRSEPTLGCSRGRARSPVGPSRASLSRPAEPCRRPRDFPLPPPASPLLFFRHWVRSGGGRSVLRLWQPCAPPEPRPPPLPQAPRPLRKSGLFESRPPILLTSPGLPTSPSLSVFPEPLGLPARPRNPRPPRAPASPCPSAAQFSPSLPTTQRPKLPPPSARPLTSLSL